MDILITLWLSAVTVIGAIGAGCMFHFYYSSRDDTPVRTRHVRLLTIIVIWLWIIFGLSCMAYIFANWSPQ